ncbi:MAG: hypothetical protein AB7F86_00115 [Bdellovibrionales bacterium]
MQPRLTNSRKWTAIPRELVTQIQQLFKQNFQAQLGDSKVYVDGRIYPSEILMKVGYQPPGQKLKQCHWMISITYTTKKDNVMKLLSLSIDVAASLFEQLFEGEDHDFPRVWQEVDFEGRSLYVQYSTENEELESEADRLLGESEDEGLAQGDWESEETAEADEIDEDDGEGETTH